MNFSLLWGENKHRARLVWRRPAECKALKLRQRSCSLSWSPRYEPFLVECRLREVCRVVRHTPCKELVTALLERWRPETNTFHLVRGEATNTLEDVEILTGLPTQGLPVLVAPDERSPSAICEQWLGVQPPPRAIQGTTGRVSWVKGVFDRLPDEAPEKVVTYHARAFTWVLLGGVLLANRRGDHILVHILQLVGDPRVAGTYSFCSAVLAWLYKVMGRAAFFTGGCLRGTGDIGGFTLLVKLWALERFPRIAERYIDGGDLPVDDSIPRGMRWLPIIERHQHRVAMRLEDYPCFFHTFQWMPYADRAPEYALHGDLIWRAVTPMLCIDCIAWHHPDRCIRQFRFEQRVPQDAEPAGHVEELLAADFRSSVSDWRTKYHQFVSHWGERD
ncbi:Serine/threonine-protein phosphatase 7 long form homolog [Linum perenne]